jgi:histone deacetylase HOS2
VTVRASKIFGQIRAKILVLKSLEVGTSKMAVSPSRCGSLVDDEEIVKAWALPGEHVGLDVWKSLTYEQQEDFIQQEVDNNGIERPQGYNVSFHYNPRVEAHHFGSKHPMKPWRLTLTKQLTLSYGLQYAMDLFESRMATKREMAAFHSEEYLDFLAG